MSADLEADWDFAIALNRVLGGMAKRDAMYAKFTGEELAIHCRDAAHHHEAILRAVRADDERGKLSAGGKKGAAGNTARLAETERIRRMVQRAAEVPGATIKGVAREIDHNPKTVRKYWPKKPGST